MARYDLDRDGIVTDAELAAIEPPARWRRIGLHGPAIVFLWFMHNAKRMAVLVVVPRYWMASIGLLVAGAVGLATIHPAAQRWLEERQRRTAERKADAL